jgi:hypothetical protein
VAAGLEVLSLSDGPSEAVSIPEDVAILAHVLVHGAVGRPLDPVVDDDVLPVAVGVGGAEHVQGLADYRRHAESWS